MRQAGPHHHEQVIVGHLELGPLLLDYDGALADLGGVGLEQGLHAAPGDVVSDARLVLALGSGEALLAVDEGDLGVAVGAVAGGLDGGVSSSDHHHPAASMLLRVLQVVADLGQVLAGYLQGADGAASADGQEHPASLQRAALLRADVEHGTHPLDVGDLHRLLDGQAVLLEGLVPALDELVGAGILEPEVALVLDVPRLAEDELGAREVLEGGEGPLLLQHGVAGAHLVQGQRRADARGAGPDDHDIPDLGVRAGAASQVLPPDLRGDIVPLVQRHLDDGRIRQVSDHVQALDLALVPSVDPRRLPHADLRRELEAQLQDVGHGHSDAGSLLGSHSPQGRHSSALQRPGSCRLASTSTTRLAPSFHQDAPRSTDT